MRLRVFGPLGVEVSVVGQGTWQMERDGRRDVVRALQAGIDAGAAHVDTAELYGSGRVEELVGEALDGRRDRVFLVSKVLPANASRRGTVDACERSLRRLRTDRLDGYLLHWPGDHPLAETFEAFEELVAAGKIRSYGVSNFDAGDLDEALRVAGPGRIACNQVLYHLKERAIEHDVLRWCERHGVAVVAYSPFGSGAFPGPRSAGGRVLARIAAARGATSHQIALAFLAVRAAFLIPKSTDAAHARDNARAADLALTPAELAQIDAAFPAGAPRPLPVL